jgi:hypothetical protein
MFSRIERDFPVLQAKNVLILTLITPQPTRAQFVRLRQCAFGTETRVAVGRLVKPGS